MQKDKLLYWKSDNINEELNNTHGMLLKKS